MANTGAIRAGRAFVELFTDNSKLVQGLRAAERKVKAFGKSVKSIGASVKSAGLKLAAIGGAAALSIVSAIKAASNLEEVMNKFNVVFGKNAEEMKAWADSFANEVGRSKRQVAEFLAGAQDLFVPIGFDEASAREMSKQVTKLAFDLASFNNMADEDTMRDLQAALTGSGEVMKKYGVIVSEAAVKQELLSQGIDIKAVTEQQKVMARLAIIMRGTTAAQGDAVRSGDAFANQMKRIKGRIEDSAAIIGDALLPAITDIVARVSDAIKNSEGWIQQNSNLIVTIAKIVAGVTAAGVVLVVIGSVISGVGSIIGVFAGIIGGLATALGFLLTPVGLVIAAVVALGAAIMQYTNSGGAAIQWLSGTFDTLKSDALAAFQGISDALAAGNIALAAKILWATLKLEWVRGITFIKNMWAEFVGYLTKAVIQVGTAIVATPLVAIFALENALFAVAKTFLKAWLGSIDFVAKKIIWLRRLMDCANTFDAAAAYEAIDQKAEDRNKVMEESKKDLDERHAKGLAVFGDKSKELRGNVDKMTNADIATNENAVLLAQQELSSAIAEARDAKNSIQKPQDKKEPDSTTPAMQQAPSMPQIELPDIGEAIKQEAIKIGTRGTFSGFAAFGMGVGSGVEERTANAAEATAKASEATAKNTQAILKELKDNQLEFA